jgi:hypothetical protein
MFGKSFLEIKPEPTSFPASDTLGKKWMKATKSSRATKTPVRTLTLISTLSQRATTAISLTLAWHLRVSLLLPKLAVTRLLLKPEGVNDFVDGVKKIKEGVRKTDYPFRGPVRWYQLVTGGEGPQFLLLSDRANWAAFEPPTNKTLDAMMEAAYGKEQGAAILRTVRSAIRSQYVETWQYRSDLSFVPVTSDHCLWPAVVMQTTMNSARF